MNPKKIWIGAHQFGRALVPVSPRTQLRTENSPFTDPPPRYPRAWLLDSNPGTISTHEIAEARRIKDSIPICVRDGHDQTIRLSNKTGSFQNKVIYRLERDNVPWCEEGNVYARLSNLHRLRVLGTATDQVQFEDGTDDILPLFTCASKTLEGEPCRGVATRAITPTKPFRIIPLRFCREHVKAFRESKEVVLGSVYSSNLPPELVKHITSILADPDGMSAREELATSKALTGKIMAAFAGEDGGLDDPKKAAALISMLDKVTIIAERQAKIAERQDNSLNYKQVLVLLSSAVERMMAMFGKNEDARNILLTILPDLPWPAGVARVSGLEGLIGQRGALLLPKPREHQALTVEAKFDGLDIQHRELNVGETPHLVSDAANAEKKKEYITEAELMAIAATPVPKPRAIDPIREGSSHTHVEPIMHYGDVQEDGFAPYCNRPSPPDTEDHFQII